MGGGGGEWNWESWYSFIGELLGRFLGIKQGV